MIQVDENNAVDFPKRPPWTKTMSKAALEEQEKRHFQAWLDGLYSQKDSQNLCFFEHNLEVWRQLWRVMEISNVLVIVVDVRNPLMHFPQALYRYAVGELRKPVFLALTKADLVDASLLKDWMYSLKQTFDQLAGIFPVSIYDSSKREGKQKRYIHATGITNLLKEIQKHSPNFPSEWEGLIAACSERETNLDLKLESVNSEEEDDEDDDDLVELSEGLASNASLNDQEFFLFTIGFVGQPNVGKSSLMNSIAGRKVVSASKTPGHTKHLQTIHLSRHLRMCDSPGLIFPSNTGTKTEQILSGVYNIAQVSDPYGPLLHFARHFNLPAALGLAEEEGDMSIMSICEGKIDFANLSLKIAYALKRGYLTNKAARPDTYRAANQILRMIVDGSILGGFSCKPKIK